MTMMNVNNKDWRTYITGQYATQKKEFAFTGTHIDTLGQTVKKDASGNKLDLTEGLSALVNETAEKTKGAVGINLPDNAGNDKSVPSSSMPVRAGRTTTKPTRRWPATCRACEAWAQNSR